tara:strand:+ start:11972 stop:13087 length:1116 start_codon:yes stop_codon:yes gene_type:complete
MQLSERFQNLVDQQLMSYRDDPVVEHLIVYIAESKSGETPSLQAVGQWPNLKKVLQPLEADRELRAASPTRRWYPLQEGSILLGVLRVERASSEEEWSESIDSRLQSTAMVLAHCLGLELERKRLFNELTTQSEHLGIMVHQLRNPLSALRTYAKLLLRKLGPENDYRSLVEGLLNEQAQLTKYVSVLDDLTQAKLPSNEISSSRLLLPPVLTKDNLLNLKNLIEPLIERAAATSNLQGRHWSGPLIWPDWIKEPRPNEESVIAEIIANLLENAFRYSPPKSSIGLSLNNKGICVWDEGEPISFEERKKIFENGFRGKISAGKTGSGIGLTLACQLANQFGGELKLLNSPSDFDLNLPNKGNAFVIYLTKQ